MNKILKLGLNRTAEDAARPGRRAARRGEPVNTSHVVMARPVECEGSLRRCGGRGSSRTIARSRRGLAASKSAVLPSGTAPRAGACARSLPCPLTTLLSITVGRTLASWWVQQSHGSCDLHAAQAANLACPGYDCDRGGQRRGRDRAHG